jgi:hypothetical protein
LIVLQGARYVALALVCLAAYWWLSSGSKAETKHASSASSSASQTTSSSDEDPALRADLKAQLVFAKERVEELFARQTTLSIEAQRVVAGATRVYANSARGRALARLKQRPLASVPHRDALMEMCKEGIDRIDSKQPLDRQAATKLWQTVRRLQMESAAAEQINSQTEKDIALVQGE